MRRKIFILFAILIWSFISCESFVEVDVPLNEITSNSTYENKSSIEAVFAGIYSGLSGNNHKLNGEMIIGLSLNADELTYAGSLENYNQFYYSSLLPENSTITGTWSDTYQSIYAINAIIEGISASSLDEGLKKEYLAEARFLRAFFYFFLVNLYGNVPLILGTDYEVNAVQARTDVNAIYHQLIEDLEFAKTAMSRTFLNEERTRPTYYAACSLLARIYLILGENTLAEEEASQVIDNPLFKLASIDKVFKKESEETIWQLTSVLSNNDTKLGSLILPTSLTNEVIPSFIFPQDFMNQFDDDDNRLNAWTASKVVGGTTYFFPYKYKVQSATVHEEYLVVFRLAEQYLIRAEARARQNKLIEGLTDLNQVHIRASANAIEVLDQQELINNILKERSKELFIEWGLRWFDLKRTDTINEVLEKVKGADWNPTDALWPLPLVELNANPFLEQNPGYTK